MTHRIVRAGLALAALAAVSGSVYTAGAAGRYKKDGNRCVWDARDSGPNQCTPLAAGRFKRSGNACVWGLITPPGGRAWVCAWMTPPGGNACVC